ncbi:MAG: thioesterase domain-containing protein [Phycisphaerales bacterium JB063]
MSCRPFVFLAALLLSAPLLTGCGMSQPISYEGVERGGSSFYLLGLWNVFSKGLDDVADGLGERGYHGHSMPGPEWKALCREIEAMDASGELRRPLVLSGHSLGADKALLLAAALERKGIDVDYVLLLDATNPRTVPGNVHRCHNIYLSHPATDWFPAFRGIAVSAVSEDTELINYDVRYSADPALSSGEFDHFDIETDPEIQQLMIDLVIAVYEGEPDVAGVFPPQTEPTDSD